MRSRVTVCIPTYNGAQYLLSAVQSVLGQSAVDLNLFIVDDCSSDTSISTVEQVVSDQRLWILKNDCRLGLVGNWNRCLDLSRSDQFSCFIKTIECEPDSLNMPLLPLTATPMLASFLAMSRPLTQMGVLLVDIGRREYCLRRTATFRVKT